MSRCLFDFAGLWNVPIYSWMEWEPQRRGQRRQCGLAHPWSRSGKRIL